MVWDTNFVCKMWSPRPLLGGTTKILTTPVVYVVSIMHTTCVH